MRLECSKEFGRNFGEVVEYIGRSRDRRNLDEEWLDRMRSERENSGDGGNDGNGKVGKER